ncbi:GNAT family N-acetyltransferase [Moritella viscosa]|uniref:Probable acetyltransferase n=1 Tax=Moritella viscosa TaxID=80854 RepID=A0A090KBE6_9GAMM|nr:GNAT family N-acetyltransferase [Moritella viscosa]CED61188.1 putative acetyltransferase, (GNAT) family [Moritella viscosa]SGY87925.1 Probable acetyltransferase [Moritella viscosa]SGY91038.1 Probable acetyltransferase [Moritella viscosa]SGY91094.1 Probable acetyltransferase [Moritella viscosa]SGY94046.1 Probable acetyltransferase [Moritella viscosa]
MNIKQASLEELNDLVSLFDQYMVFYKQPSAPHKYRLYLGERLMNNEATVFIAYNKVNEAMGFVLNYHSFSSVSLGKTIVLNDLFVAAAYRKQGVANELIHRVVKEAKQIGAIRVGLNTAQDNFSAQALYEKLGFVKDTEYFSYNLAVK